MAAKQTAGTRKRWPDPVTQDSGSCEVDYLGEHYYPHEGETVTYVPGLTVAGMLILTRLAQLSPAMEALDADSTPAEQARVMAAFGEVVKEMKGVVAPSIVGWTWTDRTGRPYGNAPADDPDVLDRLTVSELMWLTMVLRGETEPAERKG